MKDIDFSALNSDWIIGFGLIGDIGCVRVYNYALSSGDVANLYSATKPNYADCYVTGGGGTINGDWLVYKSNFTPGSPDTWSELSASLHKTGDIVSDGTESRGGVAKFIVTATGEVNVFPSIRKQNLSTFEYGKKYQLSFYYYIPVTNNFVNGIAVRNESNNLSIGNYGSSSILPGGVGSQTGRWTKFEGVYTGGYLSSTTGMAVRIFALSGTSIAHRGASNGDVIYFDDFKLKRLGCFFDPDLENAESRLTKEVKDKANNYHGEFFSTTTPMGQAYPLAPVSLFNDILVGGQAKVTGITSTGRLVFAPENQSVFDSGNVNIVRGSLNVITGNINLSGGHLSLSNIGRISGTYSDGTKYPIVWANNGDLNLQSYSAGGSVIATVNNTSNFFEAVIGSTTKFQVGNTSSWFKDDVYGRGRVFGGLVAASSSGQHAFAFNGTSSSEKMAAVFIQRTYSGDGSAFTGPKTAFTAVTSIMHNEGSPNAAVSLSPVEAVISKIIHSGVGTLKEVVANRAIIESQRGSFGSIYGFVSEPKFIGGGGPLTGLYGFYAKSLYCVPTSGDLLKAYGLYIEAQNRNTIIESGFGIWQNDKGDYNYFGGYTLLGDKFKTPSGQIHLSESKRETTSRVDRYAASIFMSPSYNAANVGGVTISRHNYFNLDEAIEASGMTVADSCLFRYDTLTGAGVSGFGKLCIAGSTRPDNFVDFYIKINYTGRICYIPIYYNT
jgi:hypothetical protein